MPNPIPHPPENDPKPEKGCWEETVAKAFSKEVRGTRTILSTMSELQHLLIELRNAIQGGNNAKSRKLVQECIAMSALCDCMRDTCSICNRFVRQGEAPIVEQGRYHGIVHISPVPDKLPSASADIYKALIDLCTLMCTKCDRSDYNDSPLWKEVQAVIEQHRYLNPPNSGSLTTTPNSLKQ